MRWSDLWEEQVGLENLLLCFNRARMDPATIMQTFGATIVYSVLWISAWFLVIGKALVTGTQRRFLSAVTVKVT